MSPVQMQFKWIEVGYNWTQGWWLRAQSSEWDVIYCVFTNFYWLVLLEPIHRSYHSSKTSLALLNMILIFKTLPLTFEALHKLFMSELFSFLKMLHVGSFSLLPLVNHFDWLLFGREPSSRFPLYKTWYNTTDSESKHQVFTTWSTVICLLFKMRLVRCLLG